jgi:hypothetical protein
MVLAHNAMYSEEKSLKQMKGVLAHERKSSLIKDGGTEDNHSANKFYL